MNELIKVTNGEVQVDSRMIAQHFGKEHKNTPKKEVTAAIDFINGWQPNGKLLREIEKLNSQSDLFGQVI